MKYLEIRNDDVLQLGPSSKHQTNVLIGKSLFGEFLKADEIFAKYNYPCILAILAEGIDYRTEWVDYIKANQHRYKIELHGFIHRNYGKLNRKALLLELFEAKEKIENTFGIKISKWYLPFGRKGETPFGSGVCKELGVEYDIQTRKIDAKIWLKEYKKTGYWPFDHINFHYWYPPQVKKVEEIICLLQEKN